MKLSVEELTFDTERLRFTDIKKHGPIYSIHIPLSTIQKSHVSLYDIIFFETDKRYNFFKDAKTKAFGIYDAKETINSSGMPVMTYLITEILEREDQMELFDQ